MEARSETYLPLFGPIIAGSLESAYSIELEVQKIWGQGGGEPLALL